MIAIQAESYCHVLKEVVELVIILQPLFCMILGVCKTFVVCAGHHKINEGFAISCRIKYIKYNVDKKCNTCYNELVTKRNNFVTYLKDNVINGGSHMIKPSKRWYAVLVSAGIIASTTITYGANDNKVIYDDSNVSIAIAVERYVASESDAANRNTEEDLLKNTLSGSVSDDETEDENAEETSEEELNGDAISKEADENKAEKNDEVSTEEKADKADENSVEENVDKDNEESAEEITEQAAEASDGNTEAAVQANKTSVFEGKALVKANDYVNIREGAGVEYDRIGKIGFGGELNVIEKGAEWSIVSSGNCYGYIKNEFLVFGEEADSFAEANLSKMAVVNATSLNVRAEGNENGECITMIPNGGRYKILGQGDDWTCIQVDDTTSGYVKNDYISIGYNTVSAVTVAEEEAQNGETALEDNSEETIEEQSETQTVADETTDQSTMDETENQQASETVEEETTEQPETVAEETTEQPAEEAPAVNPNANSVVEYALQFVGNPYVYGGTSLTNGTDCSGFTMSVYANFGVALNRSAADQSRNGTEVSLSELQPGDLVFYDHGTGYIGHVALYIGNGQIVHASTSRTGIIVADVNYSTPCMATRVY